MRAARLTDVAALVLWLASDEASFASGRPFTIDGGLTAQTPIPPEPAPAGAARQRRAIVSGTAIDTANPRSTAAIHRVCLANSFSSP